VGKKTNELPGTKAFLRSCRMSSYKVREVLDLIRGKTLRQALDILDHLDRQAAVVVAKLVRSAAANAEHNDLLDPDELYVATCFADEADTLKRWRPRARGRATRIRKRGSHITVILARMPEREIARMRAKEAARAADVRARRVAGAKRSQTGATDAPKSKEITSSQSDAEIFDVSEEALPEEDVNDLVTPAEDEPLLSSNDVSEETISQDEEEENNETDIHEEEH